MISVSRWLSDDRSSSEIFKEDGHEGRDESTVIPDDGEDSASKSA
jgi:hypothetical protein